MAERDGVKRSVVDNSITTTPALPVVKNTDEFAQYVQGLLEGLQQQFQAMSDNIMSRIDEVSDKVDELDKTVAETMTQIQTAEHTEQS